MNVVGGDEYMTRSMAVSHLFTNQYAAHTCIDREIHAIYSPVDPCTRLCRGVVPLDCTRVARAWISGMDQSDQWDETSSWPHSGPAGAHAPVDIPAINVPHVADIHIGWSPLAVAALCRRKYTASMIDAVCGPHCNFEMKAMNCGFLNSTFLCWTSISLLFCRIM